MIERCMWCGDRHGLTEGPVHDYIESTPGCWDAYSKVLATEFAEWFELSETNRLTVDTYAVQHPGRPGRKAIQSVNGHLVSLFLVLKMNYSGARAAQRLKVLWRKSSNWCGWSPQSWKFRSVSDASCPLRASGNTGHLSGNGRNSSLIAGIRSTGTRSKKWPHFQRNDVWSPWCLLRPMG